MDKNPEEGRLDKETEAILLRGARLRTVEMRRQLRTEQRKKLAKERAQRWQDRHEPMQTAILQDIAKQNGSIGPQNRATRRRQAKAMNVFKTRNGWSGFMEMYRVRFGYQQSVSRKKQIKGSITEAIKEGATI